MGLSNEITFFFTSIIIHSDLSSSSKWIKPKVKHDFKVIVQSSRFVTVIEMDKTKKKYEG